MSRICFSAQVAWILLCLMLLTGSPAGAQEGGGLFDESPAAEEPKAQEPEKDGSPVKEANIKVTNDGTFDLHAQDNDLRSVLTLLSMRSKTNIIVAKGVSGKVTLDLFDVTVEEALNGLLTANQLVYRRDGKMIYVYTKEEYELIRKRDQRVFELYYLTAGDAQTLIRGALSANAVVSTTPAARQGIATNNSDAGGKEHAALEVLVITDYPENLDEVAKLLKRLDVRPDQVLIESTILRAVLNEEDALGLSFTGAFGTGFKDLNDLQTPAFSTTDMASPVNVPLGSEVRNFTSYQNLGVNLPFGDIVPDGGASIGFVTNHVSVFLEALEEVTDVTVVANPKLLVLNKQRGEVLIGNRDGYPTTTITQTAATETVEFLETGTRLIFRPYIGKEGFVRLEIHPEVSTGSVTVPAGGTTPLPNSNTTELTSNVLIRDGRTLVIGGLFREQTNLNRSQLPLLGDIPILGAAFRGNDDTSNREEVIILITPHVIAHPKAAEEIGNFLNNEVERVRVGARKGLYWWSRTRMADTYLNHARESLNEGDMGKAAWNVKMALWIEPKMIEAIHLKERMDQDAYWSDMPQFEISRDVTRRIIMDDLKLPIEPVKFPSQPLDSYKIPEKARNAFGIQAWKPKPLYEISDEMEKAPTPAVKPAARLAPQMPAVNQEKKPVEVKPKATAKPETPAKTPPAAETKPKVESTPKQEITPRSTPPETPVPAAAPSAGPQTSEAVKSAKSEPKVAVEPKQIPVDLEPADVPTAPEPEKSPETPAGTEDSSKTEEKSSGEKVNEVEPKASETVVPEIKESPVSPAPEKAETPEPTKISELKPRKRNVRKLLEKRDVRVYYEPPRLSNFDTDVD